MKRSSQLFSWRSTIRLTPHVIIAAWLAFLPAPCAVAQTLSIGGTGASIGMIKAMAAEFNKTRPGLQIKVSPSLGSGGGIRALLAGAVDIAPTSRPPTEQERKAGARGITYAKTPRIFVTSHPTVKGVSSSEVKKILARTMRTWPDGKVIHLVMRQKSDGDSKYLLKIFPDLKTSLEKTWSGKEIPFAFTDQENLEFAAKFANSFAFASLTTALTEAPGLTRLSLDGVAPTVRNLELGVYGLHNTLCLVVRTPTTPIVQQFIAFVKSAAGARILRATGNLPYSP